MVPGLSAYWRLGVIDRHGARYSFIQLWSKAMHHDEAGVLIDDQGRRPSYWHYSHGRWIPVYRNDGCGCLKFFGLLCMRPCCTERLLTESSNRFAPLGPS